MPVNSVGTRRARTEKTIFATGGRMDPEVGRLRNQLDTDYEHSVPGMSDDQRRRVHRLRPARGLDCRRKLPSRADLGRCRGGFRGKAQDKHTRLCAHRRRDTERQVPLPRVYNGCRAPMNAQHFGEVLLRSNASFEYLLNNGLDLEPRPKPSPKKARVRRRRVDRCVCCR